MALQTSGQIKLSEVAAEFGDTAPHALSEFYGKGNAPASGEIELATDFYGASASFFDHQIDGSLRFASGDSAYLSRTPSSSGNRQRFTFSAWLKLEDFDSWPQGEGYIFSVANGSDNTNNFYFKQLDSGQFRVSAYSVNWRATTALFRDHSAWYHVVLAVDSTQSTAQNRIRLYINGDEVTAWDINNAPSQNQNFAINMTAEHRINQHPPGYNYPWGGYMAEVNFVDGQQLAPTLFGETKSGVWIPKGYTGSYGTNGFYLKFAGNSNDSSGNGNNWTANNISSHDYVPDSPTNNFITFGAIQNPKNSWSISQGNLRLQSGTTDVGCAGNGYFGGNGGKWYFEWINAQNNNTTYMTAGICDNIAGNSTDKADPSLAGGLAWGSGELYYLSKQGYVGTRTTEITSSGPTWTTVGDVIMVALDLDNGKLWYGSNGTWYNSGNPASGTNATFTGVEDKPYTTFVHAFQSGHAATFNFGQDSSFAGVKTAQGNSDGNGYGDFYYTPPSGFLALCTENMSIASGIDPNQDSNPKDHFSVKLYSGNGSTQSITGVGFQPSITWIKSRNHGHNPELYQAVEGATRMWMTSYVNSDTTRSNGLTSFNSDGFSLGNSIYTNQSGLNFVAWNWKANGAGSSNSTGSITATVSANPDAGISIIKWTGTGATGTVGHGLNSAPKFLINKAFYGSNSGYTAYWNIWCTGMSITKRVFFSSEAELDAQGGWGNTEPNSSVVYLGSKDELNGSGGNFSMLAFAPVEGFSSFGKYVGTGNADGPFIYTGFRVAYVLVKKISGAENWSQADSARSPYNVSQNGLQPGTANAENTTNGFRIDLLSNGFKPRDTAGQYNDNGATYIYMAFAENPFKYATAR